MAKLAIDIRSVLIPVTGNQILLPNATVAEVITFTDPDPFEESPSWILGRVTWRGWRVPVVSLSMLGRWAGDEHRSGAKIAVLKGLGGNADMPFMAMVTQGFPHLVTVNAESMKVLNGEPFPPGEDNDEPAEAIDAGPAALEAADFPESDSDAGEFDELGAFSVEMEFADLDSQGPELESESMGADPGAEPEVVDIGETPAPESADAGFESESDEPVPVEEPVPPADVPEDFEAVATTVEVDGQRAVIPDLLAIEKLVVQTIGRAKLRSR